MVDTSSGRSQKKADIATANSIFGYVGTGFVGMLTTFDEAGIDPAASLKEAMGYFSTGFGAVDIALGYYGEAAHR
jgi:hypothetical protein